MGIKGMAGGKDIAKPDLGGVRQIAGSLDAAGLRFGVVASRFNETLTHELVRMAVECLREHGATDKAITVVWTPGAYEVPAIIHKLAAGGGYSALIALGAVIEGETPHAEMINLQVTHSLAAISREMGIPVIHEVVAARNEQQAMARCMSKRDSRGWYAARAAIEMAHVYRLLAAEGPTHG